MCYWWLFILCIQTTTAQSVGIGTTTPNASARLEVNSTTQGILIPKMTAAQSNFVEQGNLKRMALALHQIIRTDFKNVMGIAKRKKSIQKGVKAPFPEREELMLCQLVEEVPTDEDYLYEVKLDGYRITAHVKESEVTLR